jgi:glycosyltransferase involved in cell wall biosynthesis
MRVLFLHRDLPVHGGVPQCLFNLAKAVDPKRIEFRIASFVEPSEEMKERFGALNVKPRCIGDRGYLSPARSLRRLIDEERINVIVATTFKAYLCAKMAVRGRDVGVVFWFHAVRGTIEGSVRRTIRNLLAKDDPMIFVSRAVREIQMPPGHRGPAEVIHNGVEDVEGDPMQRAYPPEMRRELGLPADALVLAYVAEFIEWKDHPTAIRTMHELVRRGVDVHLLLIGTGEDIEAVRTLANSGVARDRIHFLGVRADARRLLGVADIYLHTSREEGFGLAVVEAMLASRPVVAVEGLGGIREIVDAGRTGILVKVGSATDLADAVTSLANDPGRRAQMGAAARASCLERFDPHRFADAVSLFLENSFPAKRTRAATKTVAACAS